MFCFSANSQFAKRLSPSRVETGSLGGRVAAHDDRPVRLILQDDPPS